MAKRNFEICAGNAGICVATLLYEAHVGKSQPWDGWKKGEIEGSAIQGV
jgi:hypothetical protein